MDLSNINRIEVIDEDGRAYVNWQEESMPVTILVQDEGRTLKIFLSRSELAENDTSLKIQQTDNTDGKGMTFEQLRDAIEKASEIAEVTHSKASGTNDTPN